MKFYKLTVSILFFFLFGFIILAPLNAQAVDVANWTDRPIISNGSSIG